MPAVVFLIVVLGAHAGVTGIVGARAQAPSASHGDDRVNASSASVPSLTPEQRTTLQLRVLIFRNAQLELEALIKDFAQPGYTIDLNTLTYVKAADPQGSK